MRLKHLIVFVFVFVCFLLVLCWEWTVGEGNRSNFGMGLFYNVDNVLDDLSEPFELDFELSLFFLHLFLLLLLFLFIVPVSFKNVYCKTTLLPQ